MQTIRNIEWPIVDWNDGILVSIPRLMVPFIVGLWEKLHYPALYKTDADFEAGDQDVRRLELLVAQGESTMSILTELDRIADALEAHTTLLENLECICAIPGALGQMGVTNTYNTVYIQDQIDDGRDLQGSSDFVAEVSDLPEGYATWEEWYADRCTQAQSFFLCVRTSWEDSINYAVGAIAVVTSAIDAILLSTFGLGIPLVGALDATLAFVTYGPVSNTELNNLDVMDAMKQDLVCALYSNYSVAEAAAACQAIISAQAENLSPICYIWLRAVYSGPIIQLAYNGVGNWNYRGDLVEGYCTACEPPAPSEWEYTWPPCENGAFLDDGACWNNLKCLNGYSTGAHEAITFPDNTEGYEWTSVTVHVEWTSRHPNGWQVGTIRIQQWVVDTWVEQQQIGLSNNADAGNLCTKDSAFDQSAPWEPGNYRWVLAGQPGQYESEPYPLMVSNVLLTLVEEPI